MPVVALSKRGKLDFKSLLYFVQKQWYQSTRYKVKMVKKYKKLME
jgi:hypothetical protein